MGWLQWVKPFKLLHRALQADPWYVILYVTARCNMKCGMCFYWQELNASRKEQELTLGEMERIARALPALYQLTLTGGEPLLRQDLAAVVDIFVRHAAPGRITIPTNGWYSQRTADLAAQVCRDHPRVAFSFNLSLDGVGEEHDRIRATPHSFQHMMETWQRLKGLQARHSNLAVATATVVTRDNFPRVAEITAFVRQHLDPVQHGWMISRGNPRFPEGGPPAVAAFAELLRRYHDSLVADGWRDGVATAYLHSRLDSFARGRMREPCLSGKKMLVIQETGTVLPCEILPAETFAFGNLRQNDFDLRGLLDSPRGRWIRDHIGQRRCDCTFECAMINNFVLNPRSYPRILYHHLAGWWKRVD